MSQNVPPLGFPEGARVTRTVGGILPKGAVGTVSWSAQGLVELEEYPGHLFNATRFKLVPKK